MDALIENICRICKLSFWEWEISNNQFENIDNSGSSINSLDEFLKTIHLSDRKSLKHIFYQSYQSKKLFEKVVRVQLTKKSVRYILIRGQVLFGSVPEKMQGVIIDLTTTHKTDDPQAKSRSLLTHELSQPLMIAKTYATGCLYRLADNSIDNKQLLTAVQKINDQISIMGDKIHG